MKNRKKITQTNHCKTKIAPVGKNCPTGKGKTKTKKTYRNCEEKTPEEGLLFLVKSNMIPLFWYVSLENEE